MKIEEIKPMRDWDIYQDIIDSGKTRRVLSINEINDSFPTDLISQGEAEDLIDLLQDIGIKVIDDQETCTDEEEVPEKQGAYEKIDDLIQAYFHSMGDLLILTKDEETKLAKKLKEGKELIKEILLTMPLHKKVEESFKSKEQENVNWSEEETTDEAIINSLEILDNLITQNECEQVDSDLGISDTLKSGYENITLARKLFIMARNELIIHNLRLVINIAKHYIGKGLSLLDLIQEGNIGLMKAIDKFDYKRGFKFSTYATWWIRQAITRALIDQTKTIRVPVHMMELYSKVGKASKELISYLGREPSIEEIAKRLGVPVKKVEDVYRAVQEPIAIQTMIGDEATLEEFIHNNSSSPYSDVERKKIFEQILQILNTLTPREEKVIRMRFGIGLDRNYTLEEVGRHLSITRERVRQIEGKALKKLKHPKRLTKLKVLDKS